MKYDYSISIVQVSDLHWTGRNFADGRALDQIPLADLYRRFYQTLYNAALNCSQKDNSVVLVLGGDNVFQSNYDKVKSCYKPRVLDVLLQKVLEPIVTSKRSDGNPIFNYVIAVPGNHDIDHPSEPLDDASAFVNFNNIIDRLKRLSPPSIEYHVPDSPTYLLRIPTPHGPICFWAINSSAQCGGGDSAEQKLSGLLEKIRALGGKYKDDITRAELQHELQEVANSVEMGRQDYYPGYVEPEWMDKCRLDLAVENDYLRIAVLHHNNLLTAKDDTQKYRFLNPSTFNRFLLEHKFRIALHGHQHTGEVAAYNLFADSSAEYSSYLTNGILTIGSPAFDLGQQQTEHGFNVVRLELSGSHKICRVEVSKYVWIGTNFKQTVSSFDVALAPFDSSKAAVQREINRLIFSVQNVEGLLRVIDSLDHPQVYPDYLRGELMELQNVRAVYALSVFPPANWLLGKLVEVFFKYGNQNIIAAAHRYAAKVRSKRQDGLYFLFSKPLHFGTKTAISNRLLLSDMLVNRALKRFDELKYTQASDYLHRQIAEKSDGGACLGMFARALILDQASEIDAWHMHNPKVIIAPGAERPFHNFSGQYVRNTKENKRLAEFPRIVMWSDDELLKPSVLDIIEYHETMGFPLFWLNPELLTSSDGKRIRKRIGYVSIISLKDDDEQDRSATEIVHNENGGRLPKFLVEDVWHGSPKLWFLERDKMGLGKKHFNALNSKTLHEFIWLLGHPSLCFAADAWLARLIGGNEWDNFKTRLAARTNIHDAKKSALDSTGPVSGDPHLATDSETPVDRDQRINEGLRGQWGAYD